MEPVYVLVLMIGTDETEITVADDTGQPVVRTQFASEPERPAGWLIERLIEEAETLLDPLPGRLTAVELGLAFPLDGLPACLGAAFHVPVRWLDL